MLEHETLGPRIIKAVDKKRRPPIIRFVLARLRGVSVSAMDKLRFAAVWMPGHSTLSKAYQAFEAWVDEQWCPSGYTTAARTAQTEQEQQADVDANVGADEEVDEEMEREADRVMREEAERAPTAEEVREATAESFTAQALAALRTTYPGRDESKYLMLQALQIAKRQRLVRLQVEDTNEGAQATYETFTMINWRNDRDDGQA